MGVRLPRSGRGLSDPRRGLAQRPELWRALGARAGERVERQDPDRRWDVRLGAGEQVAAVQGRARLARDLPHGLERDERAGVREEAPQELGPARRWQPVEVPCGDQPHGLAVVPHRALDQRAVEAACLPEGGVGKGADPSALGAEIGVGAVRGELGQPAGGRLSQPRGTAPAYERLEAEGHAEERGERLVRLGGAADAGQGGLRTRTTRFGGRGPADGSRERREDHRIGLGRGALDEEPEHGLVARAVNALGERVGRLGAHGRSRVAEEGGDVGRQRGTLQPPEGAHRDLSEVRDRARRGLSERGQGGPGPRTSVLRGQELEVGRLEAIVPGGARWRVGWRAARGEDGGREHRGQRALRSSSDHAEKSRGVGRGREGVTPRVPPGSRARRPRRRAASLIPHPGGRDRCSAVRSVPRQRRGPRLDERERAVRTAPCEDEIPGTLPGHDGAAMVASGP